MAETTIWWLRRDLRLRDNPALVAAAKRGAVIPVFICDTSVDELGAAAKWRLGLSLADLDARLRALGSHIVYRTGEALEVLDLVIEESGATGVFWNRYYEKRAVERDKAVKSALKEAGVEVQSFNAHLLFEPWEVETKQGGYYKVYSPYWRAVKDRPIADPLAEPAISAPEVWPQSEALKDWDLGAQMRRGADVVAQHVHVGEERATARLGAFVRDRIDDYKDARDFPALPATSGLSENLTYGEISPRSIWHSGVRAREEGKRGAEHFLKELVWREFAWHLLWHEPDLATRNHREGWDDFPWRGDSKAAERWRQGRTGIRFVDAAMRELYVTGTMHNRARMIVASYLTKHMMTDWRVGLAWFEDCLIDWDPASNAMGWQWVAGSGPDAAPYFRVFNPDGQAEKFDKNGDYLNAWIAEGQSDPPATALSYFEAVPKAWGLGAQDSYPEPVVGLKEGRERALAAYGNR
ncbi:Deoxyribodipyrimidine photo-lyase [Aquimixticola soesokkakensis]|uniref:Deoxyribodipyrimidine photo-lyase n=1 Tax=Aquimixticola soesokkakensis TaxID=1519096 RepID=A0A1Y5SJA8_9RHOB|nr:deoxyribodipyrimidine photo-lyase [Aquimixticola soesokkakensis]SLN42108.1 Deoxyribodipyrimidine photo-lyase [Aquimixticola soesokkakensis]